MTKIMKNFQWIKIREECRQHTSGLQIKEHIVKLFSLFLIQNYVVGTQKNHLDEMVLWSTQTTCLNWCVRKLLQIYAHEISLSGSKLTYLKQACCQVKTTQINP